MSERRSAWSGLALVVLAACTDGTVTPASMLEFPFANATPSCGPADGPATAITLTTVESSVIQPPLPFVRVLLWHSPAEVAGRTWTWRNDDFQIGSAHRCPSNGTCVNTTEARVSVGSFAADSSLEIDVDLTFPGAMPVRGRWHARWVPRQFLCG